MATLLFWVVAIVLVASALTVVGARKIVHSALGLVIVFAMAAGVYLLLNAEFIAIVQILIYAGAVTILILFALMLTRTSNQSDEATNPNSKTWGAALIVSALVCAGVIFASTFTHSSTNLISSPATPYGASAACPIPTNNVVYIGQLLYSPSCYSYVLPFEIASLVLLVAIVGAIVIGRED
jgi:NADH-quinone oxidoreductase subunit J